MFVAELPTSFDHLSSRLFMSSRFFPMPVISHCWCLHVEIVPAANKSCRVAATKNLYLSSFITNVFDQNSRLHLSDILFVQLYKKKLIHHRLYARIKPCFVKVLCTVQRQLTTNVKRENTSKECEMQKKGLCFASHLWPAFPTSNYTYNFSISRYSVVLVLI